MWDNRKEDKMRSTDSSYLLNKTLIKLKRLIRFNTLSSSIIRNKNFKFSRFKMTSSLILLTVKTIVLKSSLGPRPFRKNRKNNIKNIIKPHSSHNIQNNQSATVTFSANLATNRRVKCLTML